MDGLQSVTASTFLQMSLTPLTVASDVLQRQGATAAGGPRRQAAPVGRRPTAAGDRATFGASPTCFKI